MNTPSSLRAERYEIGTPFGCPFEDRLSYVPNQDLGLCRKSSSAQFYRNPFNQCTSRLLLIFQLWSITLSHLRWRRSVNRLQHM